MTTEHQTGHRIVSPRHRVCILLVYVLPFIPTLCLAITRILENTKVRSPTYSATLLHSGLNSDKKKKSSIQDIILIGKYCYIIIH